MNFIILNVLLTLLLVSFWVGFIIWKGVMKDVAKQLEEAYDVHHRRYYKPFEEK